MKPSRDVVAGVVEASCTCCAEARALIHHIQLGPTRMVCPESGRTFLDRGDGLFQADGQLLALDQVGPSATRGPSEASDLLSDRPARTADKTRISLERATFAGGAGA
jgi:hypothetical protein